MQIVRSIWRFFTIVGSSLLVVGMFAIWDFSTTARPGAGQLVSVSDLDVPGNHKKLMQKLRLPSLDRPVIGGLHRTDGFYIGVGTVATQTITCQIEVEAIYRNSSETAGSLVPFVPAASPPYGWSSYFHESGVYVDKEVAGQPVTISFSVHDCKKSLRTNLLAVTYSSQNTKDHEVGATIVSEVWVIPYGITVAGVLCIAVGFLVRRKCQRSLKTDPLTIIQN